MSDDKHRDINIDFTWLILFLLFVLCIGEPDLLDVLQKWCANYVGATT